MAQLYTILEQHARYSPLGALPNSLGDGYLITYNSIYRNVREFINTHNVSFTTELTPEIMALPLAQLEYFLTAKKLYYYDNVSVLKSVEAKNPRQISWDSLMSHLKRNMIFHESCHLLARHQFGPRSSVLQIILEESFANSCELLAIKDVHDKIHKEFYEFNSYIFHIEQRSLIRGLIDQLGFEKVLQWTLLSYAFSNYLFNTLTEKDVQRMAHFVELPANTSVQIFKQLKLLSRVCFELNPDFKNATMAFYLKHHGYNKGLQELQGHDLMSEISSDFKIKAAIVALSKSIQ